MTNTNPTDRILSNARRLGTDAFHTAAALDIVAPVPGRTWVNLCCWCALAADPREEAPTHRLAMSSTDERPGGCSRCPYFGCDTLVVSLPVA